MNCKIKFPDPQCGNPEIFSLKFLLNQQPKQMHQMFLSTSIGLSEYHLKSPAFTTEILPVERYLFIAVFICAAFSFCNLSSIF